MSACVGRFSVLYSSQIEQRDQIRCRQIQSAKQQQYRERKTMRCRSGNVSQIHEQVNQDEPLAGVEVSTLQSACQKRLCYFGNWRPQFLPRLPRACCHF